MNRADPPQVGATAPLHAMPEPGSAPEDTPFFQWRVLLPFMTCSLIWGGTWIIIRDQLAVVPPGWSVTYRFGVAAAAMFVLVKARGLPLWPGRAAIPWAMALGFFQFMLNFNLVYRAEYYVTSGLVAVIFALLIVPNALFGWLLLGQRLRPAFLLGSVLAMIGVAALFVHEFRQAGEMPGRLWLGLGFTVLAVLSASVANVMQGTKRLQAWPIILLVAWAMLFGAIGNALYALAVAGPPVVEARIGYWAGIGYLAIAASAVTFPLYFGLIRRIGPGRAAYSSTIIPIIAMILSTLFEGYRWTWLAGGGAVLALAGLVIAMQARRPRTPRLQG